MTNTTELDSPWKEILEAYFPEFINFFFPSVYQEIDWSQGFIFLDKELQQVVRDAELGKRLVDKLVQIHRVGYGTKKRTFLNECSFTITASMTVIGVM